MLSCFEFNFSLAIFNVGKPECVLRGEDETINIFPYWCRTPHSVHQPGRPGLPNMQVSVFNQHQPLSFILWEIIVGPD